MQSTNNFLAEPRGGTRFGVPELSNVSSTKAVLLHIDVTPSPSLSGHTRGMDIREYDQSSEDNNKPHLSHSKPQVCYLLPEQGDSGILHRKDAAGHRVWTHLSWVRLIEPSLITQKTFQSAPSRDAAIIGGAREGMPRRSRILWIASGG